MPRSLEENPKELFGTLLRLEENASAFELKCTCVLGNAPTLSFLKECGNMLNLNEVFKY